MTRVNQETKFWRRLVVEVDIILLTYVL